ncbi:MAG: septum formation protein Maf [Verrucomicrobiales bacterium]|nr:septum formation protein Maf [Verrucomicrobiales bacterium]
MSAPCLILASASPRRVELLRQLGLRFRVQASAVPEVAAGHLAPREICLANAAAKARAVAVENPGCLVLGADTEVALGTRVFGKPTSRREAREFLEILANRTHQVITGVCLMCVSGRYRRSFAVTTDVTFQPLTRKQIDAYLREVEPLDKAGAYAIQAGGERIIESIDGSLTNVVGLPLGALRTALAALPEALRPDGSSFPGGSRKVSARHAPGRRS